MICMRLPKAWTADRKGLAPAAGCTDGLPFEGMLLGGTGSTDSFASHLKLKSFRTNVPLWFVRRLSTCAGTTWHKI